MPRSTVLACLAAILFTATACGATGTMGGFDFESEAAMAEASRHLATQDGVFVGGEVPSLNNESLSATVTAIVLADGTGVTEFHTDDHTGRILALPDGSVHVEAPKGFWEDRRFPADVAGRLAEHWVKVAEDDWVRLGPTFRPDNLALELFHRLDDFGALDGDLPDAETVDGESVVDLSTTTGRLLLTAETPHRLVAVEETLLTLNDPVNGGSTTGTFTMRIATPDEVAATGDTLREVFEAMDAPLALTGTTVTISREQADCWMDGPCELSADVQVGVTGDLEFTGDIEVVYSAYVELEDSETKHCGETESISGPDTVGLGCDLRFSREAMESSSGSYFWDAVAHTVAVYAFDAEAAWASVESVVTKTG
ncbi:hypothetical protein LX16_3143 [Stackebrandtia albiflava]|uniref:Lipoprotein n=1 Tax=Stackebrandtia albiflava TaxID=406432 RepID=A0A562V3B7_9ACTN|nr:hypothetical protein [Stackebrandtia albiflava]TWJ12386.1 hypothetical protein LX16_3143 [Stackebrandtia albiflava]